MTFWQLWSESFNAREGNKLGSVSINKNTSWSSGKDEFNLIGWENYCGWRRSVNRTGEREMRIAQGGLQSEREEGAGVCVWEGDVGDVGMWVCGCGLSYCFVTQWMTSIHSLASITGIRTEHSATQSVMVWEKLSWDSVVVLPNNSICEACGEV